MKVFHGVSSTPDPPEASNTDSTPSSDQMKAATWSVGEFAATPLAAGEEPLYGRVEVLALEQNDVPALREAGELIDGDLRDLREAGVLSRTGGSWRVSRASL